jgi:signal transduction histidine kinase
MINSESRTIDRLLEEIRQLQDQIVALERSAVIWQQVKQAAAEERMALRETVDSQERERQLIAYEIHDGITQHSIAATIQLQVFEEQEGHDTRKAWKAFNSAMRLLKAGLAESRQLINGLRVTSFGNVSLKAAIEALVAGSQVLGGPKVELVWEVHATELSPPLAYVVFRVAQECLTNVTRHSRSDKALIGIFSRGNQLQVEVLDWGVGFDLKNLENGGVGLEGIRRRTQLMGGQTAIRSVPGQGTTVVITLPLEQKVHPNVGRGSIEAKSPR